MHIFQTLEPDPPVDPLLPNCICLFRSESGVCHGFSKAMQIFLLFCRLLCQTVTDCQVLQNIFCAQVDRPWAELHIFATLKAVEGAYLWTWQHDNYSLWTTIRGTSTNRGIRMTSCLWMLNICIRVVHSEIHMCSSDLYLRGFGGFGIFFLTSVAGAFDRLGSLYLLWGGGIAITFNPFQAVLDVRNFDAEKSISNQISCVFFLQHS